MRNNRILLPLIVCLLAVACSPRDFLTRRLASALITRSEAFSAPQQFFLRIGVVSNKDYLGPEYLVLQRRGWITGAQVPCTANISPGPCWDVSLTPIGVDTLHDLIPPDAASKQYLPISTAKRQLLQITGISRNDNLADVEFTWKWAPLNEVGAALSPAVNYKSTVGFKHYDDGWRVLEGTSPKTNQTLEDALRDAVPAP
jgi:hypothetical protein